MKRSLADAVISVVLALLSLNALAQVVAVALGRWDDPPLLLGLQFVVGVTAAVASFACWTRRPWASRAVVAYGVVTTGLLVALGPILEMDLDDRKGLWLGAVGVLLLSLGVAWYLRRPLPNPPSPPSPASPPSPPSPPAPPASPAD